VLTYWDTGCVLKLYVEEPTSAACQRLAARSDGPLISSALLLAEFRYALRRKEASGELRRGATEALAAKLDLDVASGILTLLPVGLDVLTEAAEVARLCYASASPVPVRTLDGIHLATARLARCPQIVTTDRQMIRAAPGCGLRVVPV
jgi:predicted nucleic acid-binding protein